MTATLIMRMVAPTRSERSGSGAVGDYPPREWSGNEDLGVGRRTGGQDLPPASSAAGATENKSSSSILRPSMASARNSSSEN